MIKNIFLYDSSVGDLFLTREIILKEKLKRLKEIE
jgi:hypothetical protein